MLEEAFDIPAAEGRYTDRGVQCRWMRMRLREKQSHYPTATVLDVSSKDLPGALTARVLAHKLLLQTWGHTPLYLLGIDSYGPDEQLCPAVIANYEGKFSTILERAKATRLIWESKLLREGEMGLWQFCEDDIRKSSEYMTGMNTLRRKVSEYYKGVSDTELKPIIANITAVVGF